MSPGRKMVSVYFGMTYFIPLAADLLSHDRIESSYVIHPLTLSALVSLVGCYLIFLLCSSPRIRWVRSVRAPGAVALLRKVCRWYVHSRLWWMMAAVILGVSYQLADLSSYRYAEQSISETDSAKLYLAMAVSTALIVDLSFVLLSGARNLPKFFSWRHAADILAAAALLLLTNGTITTFLGLIALGGCIFQRSFRSFIFPLRRTGVILSTWKIATALCLAGLIVFAAWVMGEAIKASSAGELRTASETFDEQVADNDSFLQKYSLYLIERVSIYYYSFLFTESASRTVLNNGEPTPLVYPLRSFLFRVGVLSGGLLHFDRPPIGSMMVLNYRLLSIEPTNDREGSSPGVLAAFGYVFPPTLAMFFTVVYLVGASRLIDVVFPNPTDRRLSLIGSLLMVAFLQGIFQSPFDLLLVFDEGALLIGLLLVVAFSSAKTPAENARPEDATADEEDRREITGPLPASP